MNIGQEMWKMCVNLNISPFVSCDLNYTDFRECHNNQQHCLQIYTVFQTNLRHMECMIKTNLIP